jgi:hypothetical protein
VTVQRFSGLLASYAAVLPLRRASELDDEKVRVVRLLERLAVEAVRIVAERITFESFDVLPARAPLLSMEHRRRSEAAVNRHRRASSATSALGRRRLPHRSEVAALADTKGAAQAAHGELLLRLVDEPEAHRLPSRAKKAVARFRMSRSWRRISFSRRSRFSSAVTSGGDDPPGASGARSRLRPSQRTSVDSPTPRSSAISRWVRPLVRTRRTASSSNSFVNRRCCFMGFLARHRELSTFTKQVQCSG